MRTIAFIPTVALLLLSIFGAGVFAKVPLSAGTSDCSLAWSETSIPNVGSLNTVKVISANDIWSGGDGDWLHWDGTSWNVVPRAIDGKVEAFTAASTNDVWAVGTIQSIPRQSFILHWDGQNWSKEHQQDRDSHRAALALTHNSVWAVGIRGWHWDGETWREVASPYYMDDIAGIAENDIWAVGNNGAHLSSPYAWHWDGTKWSDAWTFGAIGYLSGIDAIASNDIWAVGSDQYNSLAAHWNGTTWERTDTPNGILRDVVALSPDNVYAVGEVIMRWDGNAWHLDVTPQGGLSATDKISENELVAVGVKAGDDGSQHSFMMRGVLRCSEPTTTLEPTRVDTATSVPTVIACMQAPKMQLPEKNALLTINTVSLTWRKLDCATQYQVIVKQDSKRGVTAFNGKTEKPKLMTPALESTHTYYWHVRACKANDCGTWSKWRRFTIQ